MKNRPTVCTYYFPNWHVDPRNEKIHGRGWTEWRVSQYATPRFEGHEQPRIPLWGYEDEAEPAAMARKIKAAADHGIDAFIFDWYYFSDGSYRERCIHDGFLGAPNCRDIKFALMWANHDPIYAHPGSYLKPREELWSGKVDAETFIRCTDHCIATYLNQPNYLRIDGGLYFSIFLPERLIEDLGGTTAARLLLNDFRNRAEKAGLGRLTLDARVGQLEPGQIESTNRYLKAVGFDTASSYGWGNFGEDFPALEYAQWCERNRDEAERMSRGLCVPFLPVVPQGWDASPRTVQSDMYEKSCGYPFGAVIVNNTPELYEKALRRVADFMESGAATGSAVMLPCWNEWTEGAYLEPDTKNGYGYLEAVRRVFGMREK